jgi:hypothetical protein
VIGPSLRKPKKEQDRSSRTFLHFVKMNKQTNPSNREVAVVNAKHYVLNPLFSREAIRRLLFGMLSVGILFSFSALPALSGQTREECHKCCESQGLDEYYLDQCKLQCFRSPDHCTGTKSGSRTHAAPAPKPPAAARPAPQERPPVTQAQPREQPPAMQPAPREQPPAAQRPAPQRPPARAAFQWPNPLTLVPGRESDAAAQIVVLNGISPQHPNFQAALTAVTGVLIDFARNNPAGGALPTAQLERIIKQYR